MRALQALDLFIVVCIALSTLQVCGLPCKQRLSVFTGVRQPLCSDNRTLPSLLQLVHRRFSTSQADTIFVAGFFGSLGAAILAGAWSCAALMRRRAANNVSNHHP